MITYAVELFRHARNISTIRYFMHTSSPGEGQALPPDPHPRSASRQVNRIQCGALLGEVRGESLLSPL